MEENSDSSEKSKSAPTNFSIERILLKSENETNMNKPKPLNKVTPNPWLSITPMSFKPKVVIQQPHLRIGQSSSSSTSVLVTPSPPPQPLFPQINPLYTSLLQQFPSASSFFHNEHYRDKLLPMTGLATNNNLISVNNYNYFIENHFKQVQNLTNQSYRSPSGSPLLSLSSASFINNISSSSNNDSEINVRKLFLMQNNEGSSNGSGCSSLIDDTTSNLDDGLKCGICNKMFGCAETLEVG